MATLTVRQGTLDDATELARMLDLFDSMGATPERVTARMLACQHVLTTFLGDRDGQPIGFACLRLVPHHSVGDRPLLLVGVLLAIFAMQFFSIGLIGELIVRSRASQQRWPAPYRVREELNRPPGSA